MAGFATLHASVRRFLGLGHEGHLLVRLVGHQLVAWYIQTAMQLAPGSWTIVNPWRCHVMAAMMAAMMAARHRGQQQSAARMRSVQA